MTEHDLENEGIASLILNDTSVTKALRVYARLTVDQVEEASGLNRIEKTRAWANM